MYRIIKIDEIKQLAFHILTQAGESKLNAEIIIDHLLTEELLGKSSHGFYRLPAIVKCIKNTKNTRPVNCQINGLIGKVDGGDNIGLVAVREGCDAVLKIMKESPLALVAIKEYVGTTGAMGYYTRYLANKGYISMVFCNSEYAVAPWGGMEALIGTNPISFGIPNYDKPVIVDFATSAKTYGELMLLAQNNMKVEEGVVLDSEGNPSTDPNDANNGCQLPMAGHKGYALGLIIEILSGLYIGAKSGKDSVLGSDGFFILAIKPDIFVSAEEFRMNLNAFLNEIRNSKVAPGFDSIRIPGENAVEQYNEAVKLGEVNILDSVYREIENLL